MSDDEKPGVLMYGGASIPGKASAMEIIALEARVKELEEHFDGCAGAEATINDWRQRAVKAEARYLALLKTSLEKLRFDETRRAEAAEARVKELEALLHRQAGRWTLCTVCGATARNAPAKEIVHHTTCALAKARG